MWGTTLDLKDWELEFNVHISPKLGRILHKKLRSFVLGTPKPLITEKELRALTLICMLSCSLDSVRKHWREIPGAPAYHFLVMQTTCCMVSTLFVLSSYDCLILGRSRREAQSFCTLNI